MSNSSKHTQPAGDDAARQNQLRARGDLPRHIAIIMDGNGRWAREQGKARASGHREGVESVRDVTEAAAQLGIDYLTLYTFSTENWKRPSWEVNALMELLVRTIRRERHTLLDNNVRLKTIGDVNELPPACRRALHDTIEETSTNTGLILTLALSYSGRWDLTRAMCKLAEQVRTGALTPDGISEEHIADALATTSMPDPDLLIRTGGEERISNFLLWEVAYSEMYFTDAYWPTFRRNALYEAIASYQARDRRFGRVEVSEER